MNESLWGDKKLKKRWVFGYIFLLFVIFLFPKESGGDHQLIINLNSRDFFDVLVPFVPYETPRPISKNFVMQHGKIYEEGVMQIRSNNKSKHWLAKFPCQEKQQGLSLTSFSLFGFRALHCWIDLPFLYEFFAYSITFKICHSSYLWSFHFHCTFSFLKNWCNIVYSCK